jgi:hypothetical protein
MRVGQIGTYGYRGHLDWEWGEMTPDPTWSRVEAALRRLDGGEYAGVVLHLNYGQPHEPATQYLSVCGGAIGFAIAYHVEGCADLHWTRPDAVVAGPDVGVVRRDQGVWVPECHVCLDFEVVVAAARHFCETAEPHPELRWERFGLVDAV